MASGGICVCAVGDKIRTIDVREGIIIIIIITSQYVLGLVFPDSFALRGRRQAEVSQCHFCNEGEKSTGSSSSGQQQQQQQRNDE